MRYAESVVLLWGSNMNVHEYVFVSIHGSRMPLSNYQGQPILLINTASECEYTPQYTGLQRLWLEYKQSGLVVIGMPCDDFGHHEPENEETIAEFCKENYQVQFPMTGKYNVMGISAHPIFHTIREQYGSDATPRWNFHKILFDRSGEMIGSWPAAVLPDDTAITHPIECNLQSWVL